MKKNLWGLAFAMILTVGTAWANGSEKVSPAVLNAFQNDFGDARDVKWEKGRDFVKATFSLNDQVLFAFYSTAEGRFLGVARNISSGQLPLSLLSSLKKNYDQYWITDLFEVSDGQSTSYYVTLKNADYKIVLQASGTGHWSTYQKKRIDDN